MYCILGYRIVRRCLWLMGSTHQNMLSVGKVLVYIALDKAFWFPVLYDFAFPYV